MSTDCHRIYGLQELPKVVAIERKNQLDVIYIPRTTPLHRHGVDALRNRTSRRTHRSEDDWHHRGVTDIGKAQVCWCSRLGALCNHE